MMNLNKPYLTTLTPLRGMAALLIVIFHSNLMVQPMLPRDETKLLNASWTWVDFFFILSGFIISYVYSETFRESIRSSKYWKYIGARFARIYPLHFFTLMWSLVCTLIILYYADAMDPFYQGVYNPKAAPPSLLLLHSLHIYKTPTLNTPSWSLSTEWWVYMIFPFLVPYFSRLRGSGKIITFLLIIGFYLIIYYWLGPMAEPFPGGPPRLNVIPDFGVFRCLAGFMLGMLLYETYKERSGFNILRNNWCFVLISGSTLLAMQFEVNELLLVLLFFPLIILSAAYNNTSLKKVLDTPVLQRLGDWSFSIYMVHIPIAQIFIIFLVKKNPDLYAKFPMQTTPDFALGLIYCIALVILTLFVASLTYRYIEVPARNYLNKFFKSKKVKIAA